MKKNTHPKKTKSSPQSSKEILKIVLTGGPGAGKSTAISRLKKVFLELGYYVIIIPETATELIQAGITPTTCNSVLEFQRNLFRLQREKEDIFENCAKICKSFPVVLILDRGLLDNKAYLPAEQFEEILKGENLSEEDVLARYDAVFHLVTAADGAADFYTLENNKARSETPDQAIVLDRHTMECWKNHPYLRTIPAMPSFKEKLILLKREINLFLKNYHHKQVKKESRKPKVKEVQ